MPLFSYRCTACNHEFEALVRGAEAPVCASCGSGELDKLVSRIAPEGRSGQFLKNARTVASREGHFSNYSKAERPKI
ncbi:FmdB family zinc ribbon protein [Azospirillum rugosum]|uniref:FmdB family regulatory protein n=1 Tax=Azospirillum rugosum TaxID=416170 RepID=A0ABS4SXJ8_9PROT|nr:zinc ribbon domain-containing protein [Azospirillum rugosum]MBP2296692.1 putative FmdB family regulatory protein [Azospirillum rugosum]MDQ0530495.1 putative FmdB family regulatory protein [Azospirillum rugosum]